MSDLVFPDWGNDDFFLPNVPANVASNSYRTREQITRQAREERERLQNAGADEVRQAQVVSCGDSLIC